MINNQDNWEKITNLTDEYDPEPDLASDVILKLNQRESTVKFKKVLPVWGIAILCLVVVAFILIYCFYNKKSDTLFLSNNDLSATKVEDIDKFVEDRSLNIFYNNSPNCNTQSVVINSDQRLAYIEQNYYYISAEGFEEVNLKIVLVNAIYSFSESFNLLNEQIKVESINLNYNNVSGTTNNSLYAKFVIDKVEYYLEIKNVSDAETTLSGVILSLINK